MNHFYSHLHVTEEGREATLKFLALEDECDKHNVEMLATIDSTGIKDEIKDAKNSFDVNKRYRKSLRKNIANLELHPMGRDRTWIKI